MLLISNMIVFLNRNDILCLTETPISFEHPHDDMNHINNCLPGYKISYNNDQHKYNSLAICHSIENINILEYDHSCCFSLVEFDKKNFCSKKFNLLSL